MLSVILITLIMPVSYWQIFRSADKKSPIPSPEIPMSGESAVIK